MAYLVSACSVDALKFDALQLDGLKLNSSSYQGNRTIENSRFKLGYLNKMC